MCKTPSTHKKLNLLRVEEQRVQQKDGSKRPDTVATADSTAKPKKQAACVNCRKSKVKCAGGIPCFRCQRLDLASTCQRATTKKRGRKRKGQRPEKALAFEEAVKALPPKDPQSDSNFFSTLLAKFSSWQNKVFASSKAQDAVLRRRFVYFCSYLLESTKTNSSAASSPSNNADTGMTTWLQGTIRAQVNAFMKAQCLAPMDPASASSTSAAKLSDQVEKATWNVSPFGVAVLSAESLPFIGKGDPWVSDKLREMLGYPKKALSHIINDFSLFRRIVDESSFGSLFDRLWETISEGRESFDIVIGLKHQNGDVVNVHATWWIKYDDGLPTKFTIFFQKTTRQPQAPKSPVVASTISVGASAMTTQGPPLAGYSPFLGSPNLSSRSLKHAPPPLSIKNEFDSLEYLMTPMAPLQTSPSTFPSFDVTMSSSSSSDDDSWSPSSLDDVPSLMDLNDYGLDVPLF